MKIARRSMIFQQPASAGIAGMGAYTSSGNTAEDLVGLDLSGDSGTIMPGTFGGLDYNSLIAMAKDLGIAKITYDQARLVQEVNMERVKRGQAPISASYLAPQMNFGLSPDVMNMLMIGGGALLLIFFMSGRKKN